MFGSKKEPKRDMRNGMWEQGPQTHEAPDHDPIEHEAGPDIVSPDLQTQAEGQTTHE